MNPVFIPLVLDLYQLAILNERKVHMITTVGKNFGCLVGVGKVAMEMNLLPLHLVKISMHASAEPLPIVNTPAIVLVWRAWIKSGTTVGLL